MADTEEYNADHVSLVGVKENLTLMPLISKIEDSNASFVWPRLDQNVLIDNLKLNIFELEKEVDYDVFLFDFTPTRKEWSQHQDLEAFYFKHEIVDGLTIDRFSASLVPDFDLKVSTGIV